MAELEEVYGHEALSLSAVQKWRKRFVNRRISLEDDSQSGRLPGSDLCESLRALTDETPLISSKRMCQKLHARFAREFRFRKCYWRWLPHLMMDNEVSYRVTFSEELLQVAHHAKETNFEHLFTGDESWFCYESLYDSAWAPSRVTFSTRKAQKIQTKNCLVSII
jgi:hypothetical protein